MANTRYDPTIIQKFADRLYKRADTIVLLCGLIGGIIGGIAGLAIANASPVVPLVGAVVLGFIGWAIGVERAFLLRLQAQTALCQAQIEKNTRDASA